MPKRTFLRLDEDKRERVIRAAIDEFGRNGYEAAKLGTIATAAHIANGSIYQYFDDKKDFFLYCVRWTVENFIKELDRQAPLAGMDPFDYLTAGLPNRAACCRREPALARFAHDLMCGRVAFPPGETNIAIPYRDAHIPRLIANGRKWGTLRQDVDDATLTSFFTGVAHELEDFAFSGAAAEQGPDGTWAEATGQRFSACLELLKNGVAKSTI